MDKGLRVHVHMRYKNVFFDNIVVINNGCFADERGSNTRIFSCDDGTSFFSLESYIIKSEKNVLRGLHCQMGKGQIRKITCIEGKLFVVIADINLESENYGQWCDLLLTDCYTSIIVPAEYAIGTYACDESVFLFECAGNSSDYSLSTGVRWDDKLLNINWPIAEQENPIVSEKDKNLEYLSS